MKRLLTYLLVTFTPFGFALAQVTDSTKTVISLEAIKVLYLGLDNPVRVAVPGVDSGEIYISAKNCRITKKEGNLYSIKPIRSGKTTIYIAVGDSSKIIDSVEYEIKKVPLPELRLGKLRSGDYFYPPYRKGLLDNVNVTVGNGFVFEGFGYEVTEFSIIIAPPKNSPDSVFHTLIKGNKIPPYIENRFKNMKPGYRIILDSVKAKGPGGIRNLAPIVIEMRERTY
jgi:hypothetical protein